MLGGCWAFGAFNAKHFITPALSLAHKCLIYVSANTGSEIHSNGKLIIDTVHAVTRSINSARSMQSHSNFNFGGFHLQGSHLITFKEKRFSRRNGYNNRFTLNSKGIEAMLYVCTRVTYAKLHQTLFQLTIHPSALRLLQCLNRGKITPSGLWP
jgi:hypothetical protein